MRKHDFWCSHCKIDYVDIPCELYWLNSYTGDVYKTTCKKCDRRMIRFRSELASEDPYLWQSERMRRARYEYRKDILQPGQEGYETLYGDPFKEQKKKEEEYEEKHWEKKKSIVI